jgi:hypothetical protein
MPTYAPHTSSSAIARAKAWIGKTYPAGWCQRWVVAEIFGTGGVGDFDGDRAADAEDGWKAAAARGRVVPASQIRDYADIPAGVACYWTGGSSDHGHAAVSAGGGSIYSTDLPTSGRIGKVALSEVHRRWGLTFAGYVLVTGNGYTLTDKPSGPVDKMDPKNYGPGHEGEHITWLGQRLVLHGYGSHYSDGPGPRWGRSDQLNVRDFQLAQGWHGDDADGLPGSETLRRLAGAPKPKPTHKLPAQLIDLRDAKLTTPFGKEGHPTEIEQPGLDRYADARCFFVRDDAVIFRVTGNGVTTSGSHYPRCELREMQHGERASWDTRVGKRLLEAIYAVDGNAKVVIAQIHDADDDVVMVSWEDGRIVVEWSKGKGKGSTKQQAGTAKRGQAFKLAIIAEAGEIRVLLNDHVVASRKVARAGCYQKAGAYLQSDKASAWAEVAMHKDSLKMGLAA